MELIHWMELHFLESVCFFSAETTEAGNKFHREPPVMLTAEAFEFPEFTLRTDSTAAAKFLPLGVVSGTTVRVIPHPVLVAKVGSQEGVFISRMHLL